MSTVKLSGSVKICVEYFEYAMNMILYQRNIYPNEMFSLVRKYGIQILKSEDDSLQKYLFSILGKVKDWIETGHLQKLVLAIISKQSMETVEKWEFHVNVSERENEDISEREICKNIQYILKQIVSSCTSLPILEGEHTIHVLCHTHSDASVPQQWIKSTNHDICNGENVNLKSFSTTNHDIKTTVEYKAEQ
eukprot:NODE_216_length_12483_cov_2.137516.p7 type:complete len:192 gc:universal NODE_216_length_12483_cov_2.137516:10065-9490(-)